MSDYSCFEVSTMMCYGVSGQHLQAGAYKLPCLVTVTKEAFSVLCY